MLQSPWLPGHQGLILMVSEHFGISSIFINDCICQVLAYSRLSFPSKPVSESLLERQWGTPISTVLAQEWLSWKTVSISLIFFTLYFSHSQKCWEKEVYRCLPIHVFPSSGISLLFPPSVCTLSPSWAPLIRSHLGRFHITLPTHLWVPLCFRHLF